MPSHGRPVRNTVRQGLVESLGPLEVEVFPADPGKAFKASGTAWIEKWVETTAHESLGDHPDSQTSTVTVTVVMAAYAESEESPMAAFDTAEDRVLEMNDALRAWLDARQSMPAWDWIALSPLRQRPGASPTGWVVEFEFDVIATVEPTSI